MIYQICGFNYDCDRYIEILSEYIVDEVNEQFPLIKVVVTNSCCCDVPNGIEKFDNVGYSIHSEAKSYYCFWDGSSITFTPNRIIFYGNCFDNDRIANELSRADIVILARYHKRAVLHGSAFMYRGKAYLICAPSGAGKSTLASALVYNHNDISFLADDILCISEDGCALYKGLPSVSLMNDSLSGVFQPPSIKHPPLLDECQCKATLWLSNIYNNAQEDQLVEIGGVFFLQEPTQNENLQITKLDELGSFYEAIKNIKHKSAMISQFLKQELGIINKMTNNVFAVTLRIKRDFSLLPEITNAICTYIDKQWQQQESGVDG